MELFFFSCVFVCRLQALTLSYVHAKHEEDKAEKMRWGGKLKRHDNWQNLFTFFSIFPSCLRNSLSSANPLLFIFQDQPVCSFFFGLQPFLFPSLSCYQTTHYMSRAFQSGWFLKLPHPAACTNSIAFFFFIGSLWLWGLSFVGQEKKKKIQGLKIIDV